MKQNDEFDKILDEALIEYRDAEPLLGLENRVMLRLQHPRFNLRAWCTWSFATWLAIALVATIIWFSPKKYVQEQVEQQSKLQRKSPAMAETVTSEPPKHTSNVSGNIHRQRHAGAANAIAAVRTAPVMREQFPSPAPLNSDERMLLRLARTDPQFLQTPPRREAEIAIVPIEIKPLAEESAGDRGEN